MYHDPVYNGPILRMIPHSLDEYKILDCGFGIGEWGFLLRGMKSGNPYIVGIDKWEKFCLKQKKLNIYDKIICDDVLKLCEIFKENEFDIVFACELIEHLKKEDGYKLISQLEYVGKNLIIITTPYGFHNNHEKVRENIYQKHQSGWNTKEFKKFGYETNIIHSVRFTKSLKFFDNLRRKIFRLTPAQKRIIAWKKLQ